MRVEVKICGVTSVADAELCVEAGADALGLNFWPGSPRRCDESVAREVVRAVGGDALLVAVFVDADLAAMRGLLERTGLSWAQLHGDEPPEVVAALLPRAYKAIRVRGPEAIEEARRYPGDPILLDAFVEGKLGGTGSRADWSVAATIAAERRVTLAGGLTPDNVADALTAVSPVRVDVASGVEAGPGRKDPVRVRAFIDAVRAWKIG